MTIEFEAYQGKTKVELLKYVRYYREKFNQNKDLMEDLKLAMKPDDWELMIQSPWLPVFFWKNNKTSVLAISTLFLQCNIKQNI